MANNPAEQQIFSPLVAALKAVFGRSDQQIATLKGVEKEVDQYNRPDSIEKQLSKIYTGYTDLQYDRITKYRDYDRMDIASTECQTALDIYAEEASQPDSKIGMKVWIESEDKDMAAELNGMFQKIRLESKAWGIYRNISKYGDCMEYLILGAYGVHDIQFIHPSRVERLQEDGLLGFKCPELAGVVPQDNKLNVFKPWDFIHFRILAYDQESIYGRSFMESLRKVWKQLSMLETMIVIFRIAKAVQRNIFYVDVGQASIQETAELVKQYEKFLKTKTQFIDQTTKDFKLDFNPATLLQDIVWPVRPGSLSKVDKLENNANLGPLADLDAFKNKLRIGLGIPKDFFDGEVSGAWNSKEALILQDARFSRKIQRIQDAFREGIIRLCQIHWAITHKEYLMPDQFEVRLGTISDSAERIREDILLRKAQILEILGNVAITLGINRRVWTDYLFDEVFPLPKTLRDKLMTPDPIELEQLEREIKLNTAAGSNITQHKKTKPPKKVTADNLKKGLRTFGGQEETEFDELKPEVLEEFKSEEEEILEEEDLFPIVVKANGLHKTEYTLLEEVVEDIKVNNLITKKSEVNWKKLHEMGISPGALSEKQSYDDRTDPKFSSTLNDNVDIPE